MNVVQLQQPQQQSEFSLFWQIYPRRIAKAHALKMWDKLTPEDQKQALEAIPAHVRYWRAKGYEIEFIPHPGSWLHGRRFEDEIQSGPISAQPMTCAACHSPLTQGWTSHSSGKLCAGCYADR